MRILSACVVLVVASLGAAGAGVSAPAPEVVFTSNQLTPIQEQEWARNTLLARFTQETGIRVQFVTESEGPYVDRLLAEARAGRGTIDVTGTLHGIFPVFIANNAIRDMAEVQRRLDARGDRTFFPDLLRVARMEGIQAFVPWMQATYLIAARKEALRHFPAGRDPMRMTYDDLLQWGENIRQATGQRRVGFPVGPRGLYGRFLHGYAYPSFTGSQVKRFRSPEAVEMWRYLRRLWGVTHPSSFVYEFMSEPLLLGEVWVAWDHTARLIPALRERPDDFVVLPSPAGPRGRSFISVIVGLAIPRTADNPDLGERLIEYLTRPDTQVLTLQGVAFFPVSPEAARATPTGGLKVVADGVAAQAGARDARTALLPVGLGARTGEFVPIYVDTFRRIAIQGEDIPRVLNEQAAKLAELYRATNAPCTPPDPPERPCVPD
ncbi:MAG: ABC transporter substrate-binding protein [Armatimonadota bacterium]|nr:ABC transporter substrate-binding protein [Armatimonadota bacterium]MDR7402083.1 ABC transporter substrate-binding protein [Armatimonadota bacterium]MDR7404832.1 ABC transporter substrate-binding protein [Armatimonadota bacterium]MDR7437091.1 ABC transporter substrate-binding protein [Armatimonadota bacterium]MDR7472436.1 ABC transporter substrate-binding protein [Armatimonadota bacterium]